MDKEESFIVMGAMIGILFLVVIILGVFLKPGKATVTDREVIKDTETTKELINNTTEDSTEYKEISYKKSIKSITGDFTVELPNNISSTLKEVFYQTDYYNYYLVGYNQDDVYINYQNNKYTLKDALDNEIISVYDLEQKLDGTITEETRYKFSFGNVNSKSYQVDKYYLTYKEGNEILITKDDNESKSLYQLLNSSISKETFKNILDVEAVDGNAKGYSFGDSYMYELNNNKIYICSEGNIYIGNKTIENPCK